MRFAERIHIKVQAERTGLLNIYLSLKWQSEREREQITKPTTTLFYLTAVLMNLRSNQT